MSEKLFCLYHVNLHVVIMFVLGLGQGWARFEIGLAVFFRLNSGSQGNCEGENGGGE